MTPTVLMTAATAIALWLQSAGVVPPPPQEEPARFPPAPPSLERRVAPPRSPEELRVDRYQSVQVNVDADGNNIVGDAANEPTIAIDPTNPNRMAIGWRQFDSIQSDFREAGWAYSRNNGRSWTFPGVLENNVFRSDPVLAADIEGNFYYYSLTVNSEYTCDMFKSTNGGESWIGPVPAYGGDKAWTAVDLTGGIGDGNIYAAWDYAGCCGNNWFTRSLDAGLTYMAPIAIPLQPMWGTVAVGPDGEMFVAGRAYSSNSIFVVVRSTNAKDPAVPPTFDLAVQPNLGGALEYYLGSGSPNPAGLLGQVWIAVNPATGPNHGHVYMLSSVNPPGADPLDVKFIRSINGGSTWSSPLRVNDDPVGTNAWQWFGTLSVAPNGRLDAVWNDTREGPDYHWSRVRYSYSNDDGLTWAASVPITPVFNSHVGWPQQQKLGDYYHMISDNVGASLAYAATFNGEEDIYYVRIGDYDCNGNGVPDPQDIAGGTSTDVNQNGIPDECESVGDLNCDGTTGFADINPFVLYLSDFAAWQAAYPGCDPQNGDINGDGTYGQESFGDINPFVALLSAAK
jgi:hypothetical protein